MELAGIRQRQLLPVSRDDIDISQWKDGNTPITMSSIIDGKVVEHKPYDFTNVFQSTPESLEPQLSNELSTIGFEPRYSNNWTFRLETNLKGLAHYIKKCSLEAGIVLEIGCYEGRGTRLINSFFKPSVLTCCDPWDSNYTDIGFKFKNQYEYFKHNTQDIDIVECRMTSDEFFSRNGSSFDFIYIDGYHSYEQAEKDLKNSLSALRIGGLCLVDDYIWGANKINPVRRAVNDFAVDNAKKIIRVNLDDDAQFAFTRIG